MRETAIRTPGTCIIRFMASCSIRTDSSSEMLGTRMMFGETEPSFISGMKAVPRKGTRASVPAKSPTVITTVLRGLPSAQPSIGS
jgi:hypothetical protein